MGGYKWLSYADVDEAADNFGRALSVLLAKNQNSATNRNVVIFSGRVI